MRMIFAEEVGRAPGDTRPVRLQLGGLGGETTLPSLTAAEAFWKGEPGWGWKILGSMAERSLIIAPTLYLAGERKHVLKYTLAITAAIEAVVLWQVKRQLESIGGK